MMELAQETGLNLVVSAAAAALLYFLHRVALTPLVAAAARFDSRIDAARIRPVTGLVAAVLWVIVVAVWVTREDAQAATITILALVGIVIGLCWRALRDVIEGIFLRAGGNCRAGEDLHVGDIRGRVQSMGIRGVVIETSDGELAIVPYSRLTASTVYRSPADERTAFHVFRVQIPPSRSLPETKALIREAALLCHWSSTVKPPHSVTVAEGELEIMVFALDSDRGAEIERAVRHALATPAA